MSAPSDPAQPQVHHSTTQDRDQYGRFAGDPQFGQPPPQLSALQTQQLIQQNQLLQHQLQQQLTPQSIAPLPAVASVPEPQVNASSPPQMAQTGAAPNGAKPPEPKKRSFEEMALETASKLNLDANPEAKRVFMEFAVANAKAEFELKQEAKRLKDENEKLGKMREVDLKQHENQAEQIADAFQKILSAYNAQHGLSPVDFEKGKKALMEHPDIMSMCSPMVVACSNIMESKMAMHQNQKAKEIDALQQQLMFYSQSFDHMSASPAPVAVAAPQMYQVAASNVAAQAPVQAQVMYQQPPAWAPAQVQPQQVVAMSAHTQSPMDDVSQMVARMKSNPNLESYNSETLMSNRVTPDMFRK